MKKFWLWYNDLAEKDGMLRFAIFMALAVVCWMIIPFIVMAIYGTAFMILGQIIGAAIMTVLAISKFWCTRR